MPRPFNLLRNSLSHLHISSYSTTYLLMVTVSTLWPSDARNISSPFTNYIGRTLSKNFAWFHRYALRRSSNLTLVMPRCKSAITKVCNTVLIMFDFKYPDNAVDKWHLYSTHKANTALEYKLDNKVRFCSLFNVNYVLLKREDIPNNCAWELRHWSKTKLMMKTMKLMKTIRKNEIQEKWNEYQIKKTQRHNSIILEQGMVTSGLQIPKQWILTPTSIIHRLHLGPGLGVFTFKGFVKFFTYFSFAINFHYFKTKYFFFCPKFKIFDKL